MCEERDEPFSDTRYETSLTFSYLINYTSRDFLYIDDYLVMVVFRHNRARKRAKAHVIFVIWKVRGWGELLK